MLFYVISLMQASGMKPAKFVAVTLTSLQILQMIVGIYINWYTWKELSMAYNIHVFNLNIKILLINLCYVDLFVKHVVFLVSVASKFYSVKESFDVAHCRVILVVFYFRLGTRL